MKTVIALLAVCTLSSCIIHPHRTTVTPQITGKVTLNGVPQAGTVVFYQRLLADCKTSQDKAITDANGQFVIQTRQEFHWAIALGDPSNGWGFCLMTPSGLTPSGLTLGWRGIGIGMPPRSAEFSCELSDEISETGKGEGICRRIDRTSR